MLKVNIFRVSEDQVVCSRYLSDRLLSEAGEQAARILSTAMWLNYSEGPFPAGDTSNPCVIWAAESKLNYHWLLMYFKAIIDEHKQRFTTDHKCASLYYHLVGGCSVCPAKNSTKPVVIAGRYNKMPVHAAYRKYLTDRFLFNNSKCTLYKQEVGNNA